MLPQFENTATAFRYRSNADLKRAKLLFSTMGSPVLTRIGIGLTKGAMTVGLPINGLIKSTIYRQFCGGETIEEAARTAAALTPFGVGVALDYGVEGASTEEAFDAAVPEFVRAIRFAASQPAVPFIAVKVTGFARFGLLEELHARSQALTDRSPIAEISAEKIAEWQRVEARIRTVCEAAAEGDVRVLIDAEESWIQQPIDNLVDALMEQFNKERPVVYNTFQHYLHDRLPFLHISEARAKEKGYILGAKMVRGAYMEKERRRAEEMGYPSPVQPDKAATDRDFDSAVRFCLERLDHVAPFIGTHNEHSCLEAYRYMEEHSIPANHTHVYFSQLYGMSDNITFNLAAGGYNAVKYLPYGPVKDVVPYLMRRAQENTSVAGQTGRELGLIQKEMRRRRMN